MTDAVLSRSIQSKRKDIKQKIETKNADLSCIDVRSCQDIYTWPLKADDLTNDNEAEEEESDENDIEVVVPQTKAAKRYFEMNYDDDTAPPKKKSKRKSKCYNCKRRGHSLKQCPTKTIPKTCYNCSEIGHMSKECPKGNTKSGAGHGSGNIRCNRKCSCCQKMGHLAQDCFHRPRPESCLKCDSKDCPKLSGRFKFGECSICKEKVAHLKNALILRKYLTNLNFYKGHMSRDCPQKTDESQKNVSLQKFCSIIGQYSFL